MQIKLQEAGKVFVALPSATTSGESLWGNTIALESLRASSSKHAQNQKHSEGTPSTHESNKEAGPAAIVWRRASCFWSLCCWAIWSWQS